MIKKHFKAKHVVTTTSGTAAIHVALAAAGVGPGDEVIVPPLTDYRSICGIFQLNATPVFCDTVKHSMAMDPDELEAVITKKTKVIMPVHNGGYVCDMVAIMKVAKRHKLVVVEDCAQCHLGRVGDTIVGNYGDFGCFSTNESKHMKTGEGGFLICKNKKQYRYAELFSDKCYERFPGAPKTPAFPALNVRMSEVNAAIGIEQLKKLPSWAKARHKVGKQIEKILEKHPLINYWRPEKAYCNYWYLFFSVDVNETRIRPRKLADLLSAEGISASYRPQRLISEWTIFKKLNKNPHCYPTYRPVGLKKGQFDEKLIPNAKWAYDNIIAINVNQYTGEKELAGIDEALSKIFPK